MDDKKSIGFQVRKLSNLIKRALDEERTQEECGEITGLQGWIIGYIYDHSKDSDVFQKDIEKAFNIRRSTATGILQLMEKNGYITREPVAHDARLKKLTLTQKAVDIHCKVMKRIDELENRLSKGLSEGEMLFFYEIMEKIRKNIEA